MDSRTAHDVPDVSTDWQGLSVIALASSAWLIPIIVAWTLGYRYSDPGVGTKLWICIGVSAMLAAAASFRSIKIIRSHRPRRGMAWIGASLSLPLLLLHLVSALGTLVLWLLFRNWTF